MRLVFGLGRSGLGVLRFLARRGEEARFFDDAPREEDLREARALGFREDPDPAPGRYREVIAAPGVPLDHPRLTGLGAPVIGEAELAWREGSAEIIGITGTAGKTSTTAYTAWILAELGIGAEAGGNIGTPLVEVVDRAEVAVAELSSFQLERIRDFRPRVAALLNLGEDHLDRYPDREAYHRAKLRLLENLTPEDFLVYNRRDPAVRAAAEASPARRVPFDPLPDADATNRRAALLTARAYLDLAGIGYREEELAELAARAPAVPGRFETVAEFGGVRFVDDSIATRPLAVRAALERAEPPVAWILGGASKGGDAAPLRPLVAEKVALIVAIGRDGPRMARDFADLAPVVVVDEKEGTRALERAVRLAAERVGRGTVLLAPMAASFDMFGDYRERSRAFRRAVEEAIWTLSS